MRWLARLASGIFKALLGAFAGYLGLAAVLSLIPSLALGHPSPAMAYGMVIGAPSGFIVGVVWAFREPKKSG